MPINLTNAIQVAFPYRDKTATYERRIGQWTGPASYVTGGEVINLLSTFGLGRISAVLFQPFTNGVVIILACWVPGASPNQASSGTVKYFDMAGVEIANGTDLSTYTAQFEAIGR